MTEQTVYEKLAGHLDQGVVGVPKSPHLLKILKILFPGEEAEVALKLPMRNMALTQLQPLFPDRPDLEAVLLRMAKRGTVFTSQRPGQERVFRLLPSVGGWMETPFWLDPDAAEARALAPLWLAYRGESFGRELVRGDMPVMRVLPVSRTIQDPREVLPFNALAPMVEAAGYRAVAHCSCRLMKRSVGDGCDHSTETCLHFGSMARYMVEQGMAREVTAAEALAIMKASNEEGLVHIVDNVVGSLNTICNCCDDCCLFLDTMKTAQLRTLSPSAYAAQVDAEACAGCGTCESRCPVGAIRVGEEGTAMVDERVCIGCGVCTPTCEAEAVDLKRRAETQAPPEVRQMLAARLKIAEESAG